MNDVLGCGTYVFVKALRVVDVGGAKLGDELGELLGVEGRLELLVELHHSSPSQRGHLGPSRRHVHPTL